MSCYCRAMAEPNAEPIIEFKGIKKAFGQKVIYSGLNLKVLRGEVLTICGGSGVGKSVMLKMLIGLLHADAGTITFDGADVTRMGEQQLSLVRRRIAMLFQSGALFDSLTVGENVAYGLEEHFRDKMTKAERTDRVSWALSLVDLPGIELLQPADLSGGMRKRVGLARAIAVQPEVLLYDEPTTGLDPITALTIDAEIVKLRDLEAVTSVIVTHQLRDAFYVATQAASRDAAGELMISPATQAKIDEADFVMLKDGRIHFEGSADELRASTDQYMQTFLS